MSRPRSAAIAAAAGLLAIALALAPAAAVNAVPLPSGTVSGTITDVDGNPLPDAYVTLVSGSDYFEGTAGASGAYTIPNVPAGVYWSQIVPPPTATDLALTDQYVTVAVGGTTTYSPEIPFQSEVAGVVTGAGNAPLTGVVVSIRPAGDESGVSNSPEGTPADGTFSFSEEPGDYVLTFAPPQGADYEYQYYANAHSIADADLFTFPSDAAGSPFDGSVQLVTNTTQATGAVTLEGAAPDFAQITLRTAAGDLVAYLNTEDGSYSTAGLASGSYTVQAETSSGPDQFISQIVPFAVTGTDVVLPDLVLEPTEGVHSVGVPDSYTAAAGKVLAIDAAHGITANDTRVPAGALFAGVIEPPAHGALFLQWDGAFNYAPDDGFVGTDTFVYRPSPFLPAFGYGGEDTTVTITVGLAATGGSLPAVPLAIALLSLGAGLAIVVVRRRYAAS